MRLGKLEQTVMTFCLGLSVLFAIALLAWLLTQSPWSEFSEQGAWLMNNVWGQISLIDLYGGFFIGLTLVWVLEPKAWVRWALTLTLPFIGNPLLALWLILRWGKLKALAKQPVFD
ncbi:MAG: hypothetical protein LAT65_05180 [Saccharospirillum sp.]|nr:hypothetical protein [Saccharospirillum sp.]